MPISLLVRLCTVLSASFGPSIPQLSLRNAMLAFAERFLPSGASFERFNIFYNRAQEMLSIKSSTETDEGDVFGAFLISSLINVKPSSDLSFEHVTFPLEYFISAISHLIKQSESGMVSTSMFWPIARLRLLNEFSRFTDVSSSIDLILQLYEGTRTLLGPQSLVILENPYSRLLRNRGEARQALFHAFIGCILMYTKLLSRSFWSAAQRQCKGMLEVDPRMEILVSDLRADIFSSKFQQIVQIMTQSQFPQQNGVRFLLLSYRFCLLTLILLNAKTVMTGLVSPQGTSAARDMLKLLIPEPPEFSESTLQQQVYTVLITGGLTLAFVAADNGKFTQPSDF